MIPIAEPISNEGIWPSDEACRRLYENENEVCKLGHLTLFIFTISTAAKLGISLAVEMAVSTKYRLTTSVSRIWHSTLVTSTAGLNALDRRSFGPVSLYLAEEGLMGFLFERYREDKNSDDFCLRHRILSVFSSHR